MTGVQTCALPICPGGADLGPDGHLRRRGEVEVGRGEGPPAVGGNRANLQGKADHGGGRPRLSGQIPGVGGADDPHRAVFQSGRLRGLRRRRPPGAQRRPQPPGHFC